MLKKGGISRYARVASFATSTNSKPFSDIPVGGSVAEMVPLEQQIGAPAVVYAQYQKHAPIVRLIGIQGQPEVWIFDPEIAKKVLTNEGPYPRTRPTELWMFEKYFKMKKLNGWTFAVGPEWKNTRMVLQKDMFSPQVADSYLPLLEEPVKEIVDYLPKVERLADATNYAALDMFLAVMLGIRPHSIRAAVGGEVDPEDLQFVHDSVQSVRMIEVLYLNPSPENWDRFCGYQDRIVVRGRYYAKLALEHKGDHPAVPYILRLLARNELKEEDVIATLPQLLFAGVDTTHHVLQTLFLDLAANPIAQEKLRQEIIKELGEDGPLTMDNVKKLKYLNYCMRESHRMNPALATGTMRRLDQDIELYGYTIPKDTAISFCPSPIQQDPTFVDEPDKFIPERWAPEAVEKRVGTKREVIDHRLLVDPFGFGPRMCIGARVAKAEIKALVAKVLQNYEIRVDPGEKWVMQGLLTLLSPKPYPKMIWTARK